VLEVAVQAYAFEGDVSQLREVRFRQVQEDAAASRVRQVLERRAGEVFFCDREGNRKSESDCRGVLLAVGEEEERLACSLIQLAFKEDGFGDLSRGLIEAEMDEAAALAERAEDGPLGVLVRPDGRAEQMEQVAADDNGYLPRHCV